MSEPIQLFLIASLLGISAGLPPPGTGWAWAWMTALAAGVFWAGGVWRLVANG